MTDHELCMYGNTVGFRIAKQHYNWESLTVFEEIQFADKIIRLAELIDLKFLEVGKDISK